MPKSKKKKRQDFQKVKLKVGKRLPKGDNVTNLSFKTRQIQLTQRIKEDDGQGFFAKKKENVQDLLRQCDHHSSSSRLSAVMGLREVWLSRYGELMVPTNVHGYSTILKKLSSLLIDNEATVRHAVVNLFKVMLYKLVKDCPGQPDRLLGGSLFAHLHTFLCCAMNHVHEDVRLDALLLYDVLLETCPALVVQQTGGLLRNLVGLLSVQSPAHVGSRGDATTQKLSLNPESRLPVNLFRVKVLLRIKHTLMAALNDQRELLMQPKTQVESQHVWSLYNDHSDRKKEQHTAIMSRQIVHRFQTMLNGGSHDLDDYITNPSSLKCFIDQCVPVMIQCWREARADQDTQNETSSLFSREAIEVVALVVSVIQLLLVLSAQSMRGQGGPGIAKYSLNTAVSVKGLLPSLEKLMMAGFPYSVQTDVALSKKKAKKKLGLKTTKDFPSKASVFDLNLGICDVMSTSCTDSDVSLSKNWLKRIGHHVVTVMREGPSTDQCRVVIRVIKNVFFNHAAVGHFTKVFKIALQCYLKAALKSPEKKLFYALFAEMGEAWDGWSHSRGETEASPVFRYKENEVLEQILVEFFQSLPQLAVAVHSNGDLEWTLSILKMMQHSHVCLHCKPFADNLTQVLDPIQGLFASSNEEIQQNVCAVLSTGTLFTKENFRQLLHLIRCPRDKPIICNRKSRSCVSHVLFAMFVNIKACVPLSRQFEMDKMDPCQHELLSNYLRFLFSLQMGFTGEELDKLCPVILTGEKNLHWFDIVFSVSEAQWNRHLEISEIIARELACFRLAAEPDFGFKHAFTFLDNFEHFWTQTFANRGKIHILSVLGLTKLLVHASQPAVREKPGIELQSLMCASLASVLSGMYDQDTVSEVPGDLVWQIKADLTQCLTKLDDSALSNVMELLSKREKGDFGGSDCQRQAAKSAQDFLLTDELLRHRLSNRGKDET